MKAFKVLILVVLYYFLLLSLSYSQVKDLSMNEYYINQDYGFVLIIQKYSSIQIMNEYVEKFKTNKTSFFFSFNGTKLEKSKPDTIEIDTSGLKVNYMYRFPEIKDIKKLEDLKLSLKIDDKDLSFIKNYTSPVKFNIDLKPAFESGLPQRLDFSIDRNFDLHGRKSNSGQLSFSAKGYFSTKPDSNSLNSIRLKFGYEYLFTEIGKFKYLGLFGKIGTEHPQDFKQTNLTGNITVSSIIPFSGEFARLITGNNSDPSYGIIINPEAQFIKNTAYADSNYFRFALHGEWDIPILKGQYLKLYGVAFYQKNYKPRSYIEATIEQQLSSNIFLIGKWINGELPPVFRKESEFSVGIRIQ